MKSLVVLLMVVLVASLFSIVDFDNASAQSLEIPVVTEFSTQKTSYTFDDSIIISGNVERNDFQFETFVIHVYLPNGNSLLEFDLSDDSNGDFTNTITAGGLGWTEEGTYKISITYTTDGVIDETISFEYANLIQNNNALDTISKQLDDQTQSDVQSLDSKILREQSQYNKYYKQYAYYESKLSQEVDPKFVPMISKLNSLDEKINSLINERNMLVSLYSSNIVENDVESNLINQVEEKPEQELFCFLFWCW